MTKNLVRKSLAIIILMTNAAAAWADSTTTCDTVGVSAGVVHAEHSVCTTVEKK